MVVIRTVFILHYALRILELELELFILKLSKPTNFVACVIDLTERLCHY